MGYNGIYMIIYVYIMGCINPLSLFTIMSCAHAHTGNLAQPPWHRTEFRKCIWWYKSAQKFTGTKMANSNCYIVRIIRDLDDSCSIFVGVFSYAATYFSAAESDACDHKFVKELWGTCSSKSIALALLPPWSFEKLILPQSWIHRMT